MAFLLILLILLTLSSISCITERITPPRGTPIRPSRSQPALPPGPIATPADPAATSISHITVAIRPLGPLPYDGVTLPLTSPDGRHIAVQQGPAPSWDALLALPDADPPSGSIAVYRITDAGLEPIPAGDTLPPGLLLGRSANDGGFLVESPRPNGSRWIGRIPWGRPDAVDWLVRSDHLNAHAILTPTGDLLFSRRPIGGGSGGGEGDVSIVWRAAGADLETPIPDAAAAIPIAGSRPRDTAVLIASPAGLEVAPISLAGPDAPAPVAIGPRRPLGGPATPFAAYQSIAPLQIPAPHPTAAGIPILWHARARMALFFPEDSSILPLLPDSIAAAPTGLIAADPDGSIGGEGGGGGEIAAEGHLVAVPRGLVFLPIADKGLANPNTPRSAGAVSIVTGATLPRITSRPGYVLLFGQSPNGGRPMYEVSVVLLGVPQGR